MRLLNLFEEQRARRAARSRAGAAQPRILADVVTATSRATMPPVPELVAEEAPVVPPPPPMPLVEMMAMAAGVPSMDEGAAVAFLARSWATEMRASIPSGVHAPSHAREAPAPPPDTLRASVRSVCASVRYESDWEEDEEAENDPDKQNRAASNDATAAPFATAKKDVAAKEAEAAGAEADVQEVQREVLEEEAQPVLPPAPLTPMEAEAEAEAKLAAAAQAGASARTKS